MPREGGIIPRDTVGKLNALDIESDKCGRRGRYRLNRLIERYGIDCAARHEQQPTLPPSSPRPCVPFDYQIRIYSGFSNSCSLTWVSSVL